MSSEQKKIYVSETETIKYMLRKLMESGYITNEQYRRIYDKLIDNRST